MRRVPRKIADGFTLVELLVVMVIVGIIVALITVAAMDGIRRAEERATQALIAKLETGVSDRIDALLSQQAPVNDAHRALAKIYLDVPSGVIAVDGDQRAAAIAMADYLRAELPDVFFVQPGANANTHYPLNFAGTPYPDPTVASPSFNEVLLPIGHALPKIDTGSGAALGDWQNNADMPNYDPSEVAPGTLVSRMGSTGIYGASYTAQGGIKKNLGYLPAGYDGVDNNGNGLIDEFVEGVPDARVRNEVITKLGLHRHNTARSEMLYALLVEGQGPFGSIFAADEFKDTEVQDTDGDGLPEFVDAWGQPLQFFRWPVWYWSETSSEVQKGYRPYAALETRQLDPLDPNQQLIAPAWWDFGANGDPPPFYFDAATPTQWNTSHQADTFCALFYSLLDPLGANGSSLAWDRSGLTARRAYYSKFLILSGGPDREPGVFLFPNDPTRSVPTAMQLTVIENQAAPIAFADRSPAPLFPSFVATEASLAIQQAGQDDITNHNLSATGTGVR